MPLQADVQAQVVVEADLAPSHVAEPISLAPDVWWGVTPRWTIGLVHSDESVDRIQPGATFCLRQDDPLACTHVYRGSGLDVRYRLEDWIAPRVRFLVRDIDPVKPAVTLGALLHAEHHRWGITSDPYLQIGLANTDQGNRAALWLPVRGSVRVACSSLWLDTGWNSDLAVWRDGWHIPVGVGASTHATDQLELGAELGFRSLLGPQNTPKERVLFVFVATRWQP